MTIKSIAELLLQADTTLEDNTSGNITPSDLRAMIKDFLDTVSPAYGAIQMSTGTFALSAAATVLSPFSSVLQATADYYQSSAANGTVKRLINTAGLAGATDFLIVTGTVAGPNNNNVRLELYKNGVATGYVTSVTCTGAGDYQGFNIAGITYTGGNDATYDLRATGPAGSYTFQSVVIVAQAQPVRSFT